MKILLYTDLHMCPRASIINKWGMRYPIRLENCIASLNWAERLAEQLGCALVINLGDFYDKPDLTSDTITACNDIEWSTIPHYNLVGNHDASISSLAFNSVNNLLSEIHKIVIEPTKIVIDGCELCFLPYIVEYDRRPLTEYFGEKPAGVKRVLLSHNDISGIQLGPIVSKTGFSLEEIEAACDLFLNGHLHNGQQLTKKVYNIGNLTGKDFGEDASRYSHVVAVLDTDTLSIDFIENPHAFNFYKIQIDTKADLVKLEHLKSNAVVSIKCESNVQFDTKAKLESLKDKILESRIILTRNVAEDSDTEATTLDLSVDHLARFIECCKSNIEHSTLLEEELAEVCK